jgi:hypothetical protein
MKIVFYQLDSLLHELQQKKDAVRDHVVRIDKYKVLIDPVEGWEDKYWLYVVVSAASAKDRNTYSNGVNNAVMCRMNAMGF